MNITATDSANSGMPDADLASLAAALSSGLQTDRLLRLHTPLDDHYGPDTLIPEQLDGHEVISSESINGQAISGYRFELTALSHQSNIPLNPALGQPVLIELLTAQSRTELRPLHGHITRFERIESDGGLTRYRLTVEPWLSLLRHRRDSAIFQDKTVIEILEAIFRDGTGEGAYTPSWRFELTDPSRYPKRSLTTQYQESDLDFIHRLMSEEGLYYWFTHSADITSPQLGQHTLIIADHNDAFVDNAQAHIAYTQAGTVLPEDSIDGWQEQHSLATHQIKTVSWDYRAHKMVAMEVIDDSPSALIAQRNLNRILSRDDSPGQYAYSNSEQAQRMAHIALDGIRTQRHRITAQGTVRTAAPGTRFTLTGHSDHAANPDAEQNQSQQYLISAVYHYVRNNLMAHQPNAGMKSTDKASYRNRLNLIPRSTTYRSQTTDGHGLKIHPKPTVQGQQTAIVVGDGSGNAIHTDRDHRIKIRFHWQRGDSSHSRLSHPYPDDHSNANGGTWVRVLANTAPIAGDNWGSVNLPRVGQEVLVDFMEGDIDRPIVIASLYNGQGLTNAAHNQVNNTAPNASANAPAWFAGDSGNNNHPASLSGIKTQSLSHSHNGLGAYNQLVFDDSAGQSRIGLQQYAAANQGSANNSAGEPGASGLGASELGSSELNLGHLLHQYDNQRLDTIGHGLELKTANSAAVRAGDGLLISSDRQPVNGMQMDSTLARNLQQQHYELSLALAKTAYAHHPQANQQAHPQPQAEQLPALTQQQHSASVISQRTATQSSSEIDSYSEPQLQLSSPAGIIAATAGNAVLTAGHSSSLTAQHDISSNSQGQQHHAVKNGIHLFTQGEATNPNKPNQETGIRLHAAQGKFSSQSQSGATHINAAKTVHLVSTQQAITIVAPNHLLLTAGGAYIRLEGGNIEVHGPGKMAFNASLRELAGAKGSSLSLPKFSHWVLNTPTAYSSSLDCYDLFHGKELSDVEYTAKLPNNKILESGLNPTGKTNRIYTDAAQPFDVLVGSSGAWGVIGDDGDVRNNTGEAHHDEGEEDA